MVISIDSKRQTKTKPILGRKDTTGLPQVRKWSGKKFFKVREFYFESGKIDIIFEENSAKLEIINHD